MAEQWYPFTGKVMDLAVGNKVQHNILKTNRGFVAVRLERVKE